MHQGTYQCDLELLTEFCLCLFQRLNIMLQLINDKQVLVAKSANEKNIKQYEIYYAVENDRMGMHMKHTVLWIYSPCNGIVTPLG